MESFGALSVSSDDVEASSFEDPRRKAVIPRRDRVSVGLRHREYSGFNDNGLHASCVVACMFKILL